MIICHRGNIYGVNTEFENNPEYLETALSAGFDIETDVWYINNKFLLGHDKPQYEISLDWLKKEHIWCHCKNVEALYELLKYKSINCFFHDQDDYTLTSHGYIWTYPKNIILTDKSIAVMPEKVKGWNLTNAYGICTDFSMNYK